MPPANRVRDLLDALGPRDPVDVADTLRRRSRDDATWASLAARDDSPAGAALRRFVADRQDAWAHAALLVECAAGQHQLLRRQWAVVEQLAQLAGQHGPAGPVYATAAGLLAETLVLLAREGPDPEDESSGPE